MGRLTFIPYAGLCNRMNAMVCALAAARVRGYELEIYWNNDKDCRASFIDLFELPDYPKVKIEPLRAPWLLPSLKRNLYVPGVLRALLPPGHRFSEIRYGHQTHSLPVERLLPESEGNIYVCSYNRFCEITEDMENLIKGEMSVRKVFKPTSDLQKRIEETVGKFKRPALGVHIRRTDNTAAISGSPTELYFKEIDRLIEEKKAESIFVASDSSEEIEDLRKRYGERIVAPENRVLSRTSLEGMEQAVVDLYSLASTDRILGSAASTFSTMAGELGEIPVEIISPRGRG